MTLNPAPKGFLVNFSQFLDVAHISTLNCDEIVENRPKQPAYEIFSIQRSIKVQVLTPYVQEGRRRLPP